MTLDQRGNIYITNADGVTVFDKEGQQIDQIPIPEDWTATSFGGKTATNCSSPPPNQCTSLT